MGLTAAVIGASGYAGGELLRLLAGHPDLTVGPLVAATSAGAPVASVHPHLPTLADRVFLPADAAEPAGADVVFLALPPGEAAGYAARLPAGLPVLDLSPDHRLNAPGGGGGREDASADARRASAAGPGWPRGLPELPGQRDRLRGASRVALPGCYPTAVTLGLAPLLAAGLVEAQDLVVVAASGTSGAGHAARRDLLGSEVMGDVRAYGVAGTHRHVPEVLEILTGAAGAAGAGGGPATASFTPVLVPMPRGILAVSTARLRPGTSAHELAQALADAYADEPFVHLPAGDAWPRTAATLGSNSCHVRVDVDAAAGRAVVVSAIDNLVKGAAGQALQVANLLLGLAETTGLPVNGTAP